MEPAPRNEAELEERLSRPDDATCEALARMNGDIMVLGAGGKMGPTLARMARRALDEIGATAGSNGAREVVAVSRFNKAGVADSLEQHGIRTVSADLTDARAVKALPRIPNVIWMVGQKFGSSGDPVGTWAQNVVSAAHAGEALAGARVVCFSTGNVYPRTTIESGGAREDHALHPDGEYAASCIGRERVFELNARQHAISLLLFRLFYACDLRYGVVTDLALRIAKGEPVSRAAGAVNVIWQGDANRLALRALAKAGATPVALNVTGPVVRVEALCDALAAKLGKPVAYMDTAGANALIANVDALHAALPYDAMPLDTLLDWTTEWLAAGGPTLGKPTKFEVRDGVY